MTVIRAVEVKCDGPDADNTCPNSAAWTDYGSAKGLRSRMAELDGWKTGLPGGRDLCSDCRPAPA